VLFSARELDRGRRKGERERVAGERERERERERARERERSCGPSSFLLGMNLKIMGQVSEWKCRGRFQCSTIHSVKNLN
jgi:hypothetical protein